LQAVRLTHSGRVDSIAEAKAMARGRLHLVLNALQQLPAGVGDEPAKNLRRAVRRELRRLELLKAV
jgi:hypothetical protein